MVSKLEALGGQAVIEGVMMKSEDKLAVAVRLPNKTMKTKGFQGTENRRFSGKIKIKVERLKKLNKFWRIPVIRGFVQLILILIIGIKALSWSADQQLAKEEKLSAFGMALTILFSLGMAVLFFIIAPFFLTRLIVEKGFLFNLVDGIIRIIIFIIYIVIIAQIKDIKTLFRYHGAEHKTVNCYEAKQSLTIKNIKKFSTLHPRCGTAFILIVLIISIFIFSLVHGTWQLRLLSRIILIPVIAGISYEILKLSARFKDNIIMKIITAPGLAMQKLTTKEPTERMIEVAVAALKKVK